MVGMFAIATASALMGPARATEGAPSISASASGSPSAPLETRAPGVARPPEISAAELWMATSRDPAGTDRTFRDRSVLVTGTIRSIDHDFEGHLVARLNTGDAFETVNATLATRDDPALAGVSKGRVVSLLCVGRGVLMGAPLLGSCFVR